MYFVTMSQPGYVLFCTTPSGRAAIGLTEEQTVRLLIRGESRGDWSIQREWPSSQYSHTAFMAALRTTPEPADPLRFLDFVPDVTRTGQ